MELASSTKRFSHIPSQRPISPLGRRILPGSDLHPGGTPRVAKKRILWPDPLGVGRWEDEFYLKRREKQMKARGIVWFFAAVCGLTLLGTMPCLAAQSVLEMVPDDALGAVVINQLTQTDAKILKLGQQIQMPVPSPLMMFKAMAKAEKGLDEKGSAAVIAMPAKEDGGRPNLVIAVPVSDYKAFVGQFEPEKVSDAISKVTINSRRILAANKDGYALFAHTDDQETLEAVLESDKSIAAEVEPWKQWAASDDAVAIVTRHGLKLFFARADKELEKAKEAMASMGDQGAPGDCRVRHVSQDVRRGREGNHRRGSRPGDRGGRRAASERQRAVRARRRRWPSGSRRSSRWRATCWRACPRARSWPPSPARCRPN